MTFGDSDLICIVTGHLRFIVPTLRNCLLSSSPSFLSIIAASTAFVQMMSICFFFKFLYKSLCTMFFIAITLFRASFRRIRIRQKGGEPLTDSSLQCRLFVRVPHSRTADRERAGASSSCPGSWNNQIVAGSRAKINHPSIV